MTRNKGRPTSPHLSIYKPQISSVMSIMHRITGAILFICILSLSWIMILMLSNIMGIYSLGCDFSKVFYSMWFDIYLGCFLFCLYYHFLNGVRHLFWDIGCGFEKSTMHISGWAVILLTVVMTILTMYLGLK
jgi:succinate dehydrogenase / fumarate reductase cytochrome b subunit